MAKKKIWWQNGYSEDNSAIDFTDLREQLEETARLLKRNLTNDKLDRIVDENVQAALAEEWRDILFMVKPKGKIEAFGDPDAPFKTSKEFDLKTLLTEYAGEVEEKEDLKRWIGILKECTAILEKALND